ncbi:MAG: hypothetical protein DRN03_03470 [Thermoplasmata archaeon]|nr:MAG: hypothetical protein DRN03_03470 [Thermoplasmata archaeon]
MGGYKLRQIRRIFAIGVVVSIVLATAPIIIGHHLEPVEKTTIKTTRTEKFIGSDVPGLSWIYIKGMPDAFWINGTFGHVILALTLGIHLNITMGLKFENYYEYTTIVIDGKRQSLGEPSKVIIKNFYGFGTRIIRLTPIIGRIKFVGRGNITITPLSS